MRNSIEDQSNEGSSVRYRILQPLRDLESNWAVDLAKNLEEYLLKICSGEITGEDDGQFSVNFAEAALLLQGSIQVYSRKVEYLYSLVLHALEFISQTRIFAKNLYLLHLNRPQDQPDTNSVQPDGVDSHLFPDEDDELFVGLDDVQVEAKNCLNDELSDENNLALHHFVKAPSNLVVLEGDCLDATRDAGELESYLLATCDLYQDFLLLDPCDAVAVNNFLKGGQAGTHQNVTVRGSSLKSKSQKSFQSPARQSGETSHQSSLAPVQNINVNNTPGTNVNGEINFDNGWAGPSTCNFFDRNDYPGNGMDGGYSEHMDDRDGGGDDDDNDDDDDPWKPLNPHEPGNLKIKPFKKVKVPRRQDIRSAKQSSLSTQFPPAKLHGTIDPELSESWEAKVHALETLQGSQSPSLYEKLRQSLVLGGHRTANAFGPHKDEDEDDDHDRGNFEDADVNLPNTNYMETEIPEIPLHDGEGDDAACFDRHETFGAKDPHNLEDLCRAHLDALLASISETEQQSELAARVSSWKQRIEQDLEEQDLHKPFDIHEYGGRVLEKLSLEADGGGGKSFTDIVEGQEKYDVARTFSALLQLVNNGDVDIDKMGNNGSEPVCYTAINPFYVRLLNHDKRQDKLKPNSVKKRIRSPLREVHVNGAVEKVGEHPKLHLSNSEVMPSVKSSQSNKKFPIKLEKVNRVRCSPEEKRRRKFQLT